MMYDGTVGKVQTAAAGSILSLCVWLGQAKPDRATHKETLRATEGCEESGMETFPNGAA
jgi:hypothetical protein